MRSFQLILLRISGKSAVVSLTCNSYRIIQMSMIMMTCEGQNALQLVKEQYDAGQIMPRFLQMIENVALGSS